MELWSQGRRIFGSGMAAAAGAAAAGASTGGPRGGSAVTANVAPGGVMMMVMAG